MNSVRFTKASRNFSDYKMPLLTGFVICVGIVFGSYLSNLSGAAGRLKSLDGKYNAAMTKLISLENKLAQIEKTGSELWTLADPLVIENSSIKWNQPAYRSSMSGHLNNLDNIADKILADMKLTKNRLVSQRRITESFPTQMPVMGLITSRFGIRKSPFGRKRKSRHRGIDIAAKNGTKIHAAGRGIVRFSGYVRSYGNYILIDHGNGISSRYAHASKLLVENGQFVKPGQLIAKVGSSGRSTGPHLHFEVLLNGRTVDPEQFLFVMPPFARHLAVKQRNKKSKLRRAVGGGTP